MASKHETKRTRQVIDQPAQGSRESREAARRTLAIGSAAPIDEASASQWNKEEEEGFAGALRIFFLSHTFDPLTGEVHTLH
jgi:hypothetical protein